MTDNYNDILLDGDGEDQVSNGDFDVGDGRLDDCSLIFLLNEGGNKKYPLLGPNLHMLVNKPVTATEVKQRIGLHFSADGKDLKYLELIEDMLIDMKI